MGYVRTAGMSTAARRARRRTALVLTGLVAVLLLALLLSVATMQGWFGLGKGGSSDTATTSAAAPAPPPSLTPKQVTVNVYNSTGTEGLAGRTAEALRTRGFTVDAVGNVDAVQGVGVIRHGPKGKEAAQLLKKTVGQKVELALEAEREDASVDLVLGPDWKALKGAKDAAKKTDGR